MKRRAVLLPIIFALLASVAGISACRKKGLNQGLDPNDQKPFDFMSAKVGTYWHYGSRDGANFKRFAKDKDTVKNTLTYKYYERQEDNGAGLTPEYYGKNGTKYITLLDLDGSQDNYLEYVFWLEGAKKGDSWQNTGVFKSSSGNASMYTNSNEVEDNMTIQIDTNIYTNVIHVHSDVRTVTLNSRIGTIDMFFKKGLGVIKEEAHINAFGLFTYDHTDSLIDYHLAQ
jgi:hypothetical protein